MPLDPLAHTSAGAGPEPVLLLHGFLGSRRNLGSLARALAAAAPARRFVALDLPGHGDSPPLPPGADLATLARAVLDTAAALALPSPFAAVGHSLGGRVALAATLEAPGALCSVTLLDVGPGPLDPARADLRSDRAVLGALLRAPAEAPDRAAMREHFLAAGVSVPFADWLLTNLARRGDRFVWRFDRPALAALRERTDATDLWPAVERPPAPLRLRCIRGGRSTYVGPADARRLEAAGCTVETIVEAGHWLHVDRLDALVQAILAGLAPLVPT